jgi:hypothetical protein
MLFPGSLRDGPRQRDGYSYEFIRCIMDNLIMRIHKCPFPFYINPTLNIIPHVDLTVTYVLRFSRRYDADVPVSHRFWFFQALYKLVSPVLKFNTGDTSWHCYGTATAIYFSNSLIKLTISIAPTATSKPLLPDFVPARSTACSIFSVVMTPNMTGTPVCRDT